MRMRGDFKRAILYRMRPTKRLIHDDVGACNNSACVCVCVMCNLKESSGTNTPSCRAFSKVRQNVIQRLP